MDFISSAHGSYYATDCANFISKVGADFIRIAITTDKLSLRMQRGQKTQLGQLYGVISTGAIMATSAHRGLNRGMKVGNNGHADLEKFALILNPKSDAVLVNKKFNPASIKQHPAPDGTVFCIYLSLNKMLLEYPDVDCWIEHWTWIEADPSDATMPVDYLNRYDKHCHWQKQ